MTTTQLYPPLEVHIDLAACTSKADLLDRFAAALSFPSWFGHNWDAMHDCLTDLSWLPAAAYQLVLSHPALLREQNPELLTSVLQVLGDAATFWAGQGLAFSVKLVEDGEPSPDTEI